MGHFLLAAAVVEVLAAVGGGGPLPLAEAGWREAGVVVVYKHLTFGC